MWPRATSAVQNKNSAHPGVPNSPLARVLVNRRSADLMVLGIEYTTAAVELQTPAKAFCLRAKALVGVLVSVWAMFGFARWVTGQASAAS
jgi:hypothetical protein